MANPARYDGSRPEPPYRTVDDDREEMMAALDRKDAQIERLRAALEPFAKAGQMIEKRQSQYKDRIVMIGGLGEPRDLYKRHFADALKAFNVITFADRKT